MQLISFLFFLFFFDVVVHDCHFFIVVSPDIDGQLVGVLSQKLAITVIVLMCFGFVTK